MPNSIFLPSVSGALVGSYVWWRRPQSRLNVEEYIQYKAMLISLATHLLLLMFELLAADNLQSRRHLWILVRIIFIQSCTGLGLLRIYVLGKHNLMAQNVNTPCTTIYELINFS